MNEVMSDQESTAIIPFLRQKKNYLWALAGVGALHGILYSYGLSYPPSQMGLELFMGFTFNLALLGWCYADSQEKGIPITRFLGLALLIAALIGVPWYFLRSRRLLGAIKGALGLGLVLLYVAPMCVTFAVCEGITGHLTR